MCDESEEVEEIEWFAQFVDAREKAETETWNIEIFQRVSAFETCKGWLFYNDKIRFR